MTSFGGIARCSSTSASCAATCCKAAAARTRDAAPRSGCAAATACGPTSGNASRSGFEFPQILEFYASTEGNVSLVNVDGKPGSVGRVPPFLGASIPGGAREVRRRRRTGRCATRAASASDARPARRAKRSAGSSSDRSNVRQPVRGLHRIERRPSNEILRDVFEPGDAWVRTGDLLRQDERGYFYFVDRIGDTFRWKGENVATSEVADAICAFPGIKDAAVYGVAIPGTRRTRRDGGHRRRRARWIFRRFGRT